MNDWLVDRSLKWFVHSIALSFTHFDQSSSWNRKIKHVVSHLPTTACGTFSGLFADFLEVVGPWGLAPGKVTEIRRCHTQSMCRDLWTTDYKLQQNDKRNWINQFHFFSWMTPYSLSHSFEVFFRIIRRFLHVWLHFKNYNAELISR